MAVSQTDATREKIENKFWLKEAKSLQYLKSGLVGFTDRRIRQQHESILTLYKKQTDIQTANCNECTLDTILPDHDKEECRFKPTIECFCNSTDGRRKCPKAFCGLFYDNVVLTHEKSHPIWTNSDPKRWCSDHWSLAQCYMDTDGYADTHSAADTDVAAILAIILNNNEIRCYISLMQYFEQVARTIWEIMNEEISEDRFNESNLTDNIQEMMSILRIEEELKEDKAAQNASEELQQLLKDQIPIDVEHDEFLQDIISRRKKGNAAKPLFHTYETERTKKRSGSPLPGQSTKTDATTAKEAWDDCLKGKSEGMIKKLLDDEMLPNSRQLQKACMLFGRKSDSVALICKKISESISKGKHGTQVKRIVPAYNPPNENDIIFVLSCEDTAEINPEQFEYQVYIACNTLPMSENRECFRKEKESKIKDLSQEQKKEMKQYIKTLGKEFFRQHRNISVVSMNACKSMGFRKNEHSISEKPCIVIGVHDKGYVPICEDEIPAMFGQFATDIREAKVERCTRRFESIKNPFDFHDALRMGCAVGNRTPLEYGTIDQSPIALSLRP